MTKRKLQKENQSLQIKNEQKGKLYLIATPIGNLSDISCRTIEILKKLEFLFVEDTRYTRKLLNLLKIDLSGKNIKPLHQHSGNSSVEEVKEFLLSGFDIGYCVDAGTPNISDPGLFISSLLVDGFQTIGIPGPSSLTTFLSCCGLSGQKFMFLGFLPKKGNSILKFLNYLSSVETIIFFESPKRIKRTVKRLKEIFVGRKNVYISIGRELTKVYEEIIFSELESLNEEEIIEKGEFIVGIGLLKFRKKSGFEE